MSPKFLLWTSLIIPWLSLFFIKKQEVKRFMPVAIFICLIGSSIFEMAYVYHWWELNQSLFFPFIITNVYYIFGAFLVGTIWIFHFTYGHFWRFLITNAVLDLALAYPINYFAEQLGIYRLVHFTNLNVFFLAMSLSIILYGYQLWQDEVLISPDKTENKHRIKGSLDLHRIFHIKDKAK
jgi:hypothetical protein